MPTRKRVAPWRTLAVAQGNAIQGGGVLGAAALAWYAGRKEPAQLMISSPTYSAFLTRLPPHSISNTDYTIGTANAPNR